MSERVEAKKGKETESKKDQTKKKKKKWPWVVLAFLVLLNVGGFAFYEYSNTPEFCNSCHIMEPYYDAWHSSSHTGIACIECHISPEVGSKFQAKIQGMIQAIKYITHTYASKPYAEIEDSSCLRSGCHDQRMVVGFTTEKFKKNVSFDHENHLTKARRGKELRCTSCHSQMVIGNHMEVNSGTCFLCHFKNNDEHEHDEQADCRLCHKDLVDGDLEYNVYHPFEDGKVIASSTFNHVEYIGDRDVTCTSCHENIIQGRGEARKDHCSICHNKPENLERFDDTTFIHDNHITEHNVSCERCHDPIKHEIQPSLAKSQKNDCSQCHTPSHETNLAMYSGIGAKGFDEAMPSSMFTALVSCSGCHYESEGHNVKFPMEMITKVADSKGCINCHGDDAEGYIEMFDESKADVMASFLETKARFERVKRTLSSSTGEVAKLLKKGEDNLKFIESSKGWVHNPDYTTEILSSIDTIVEELK